MLAVSRVATRSALSISRILQQCCSLPSKGDESSPVVVGCPSVRMCMRERTFTSLRPTFWRAYVRERKRAREREQEKESKRESVCVCAEREGERERERQRERETGRVCVKKRKEERERTKVRARSHKFTPTPHIPGSRWWGRTEKGLKDGKRERRSQDREREHEKAHTSQREVTLLL